MTAHLTLKNKKLTYELTATGNNDPKWKPKKNNENEFTKLTDYQNYEPMPSDFKLNWHQAKRSLASFACLLQNMQSKRNF